MLLAVDVGNTNVSFGVLEGGKLLHHLRSESARQRTSDEYAVQVRQMMQLYGVAAERIDAAIIASVVPALTDTMVGFVRRAFELEPIVVGPGIKTGMPILYEDPREVGADRIVNAVAGYEWAKGSVIVVDFGTATTFDCVSKKGEYLGGVITPGVQISADALFSRAARLHRVDLAVPPRAIGKNSTQSMQSGIVYGYAGLVDGLCARLRKELGEATRVIATGGLAPLICKQTESVEAIDNDLTLTGLWLIHERNIAPRSVPA
jgi:type III pantothenate kinase